MLENEENKMNTENNESEVKNESNIENVETVKNDAEDSATNKARIISKEPRALPSTVIPISRIIRNRITLAVTGTAIIRRHHSREENTDTA